MPIRKIDVALEYLSDALQHYKERHFFSALTLGAVAEEILGQAIAHLPTQVAGVQLTAKNALGSDIDGHAAFENALGMPRTTKKIREELLYPKNSAKHFTFPTESTLEIDDPQFAAGDFLLRAIWNYRMVFPHLEEQFQYEQEEISVYQLNRGPLGQPQGGESGL